MSFHKEHAENKAPLLPSQQAGQGGLEDGVGITPAAPLGDEDEANVRGGVMVICSFFTCPFSDHSRGRLIMILGVLLLVPDGTLVKLVQAPGETVAFWRLGFTFISLSFMQLILYKRHFPSAILNVGVWGFTASFLMGCNSVLFILAVKKTTIANVLLILSTSTFWAALLCRVAIGNTIRRRTWFAMPCVFFGVGLSVSAGLSEDSKGPNAGDLLALCMAMSTALRRTIMRMHTDIDMLPSPTLGCFIFSIAMGVLGNPADLRPVDVLPLSVLGFIFLPASIMFTTVGSQMLPSAESCLLLCLETVFSPILAAFAVGDQVTIETWMGLIIIVVTLIAHAMWPESDAKRAMTRSFSNAQPRA